MPVLIQDVIERPTTRTKAVREAALDKIMPLVCKWFGKDWDGILHRKQLDKALSWHRDGYESARRLDDDGWCPDAELVEMLDCFGGYLHGACHKAEQEWVKETGIKPSHKLGDVITGLWGNESITGQITSINAETAYYTVQRRGDSEGSGACVKFEDVKEPA